MATSRRAPEAKSRVARPPRSRTPSKSRSCSASDDAVGHPALVHQPAVREDAPPRGGLVEQRVEGRAGQLGADEDDQPAPGRALVLAQAPAAVAEAGAVAHAISRPSTDDGPRVAAGLEEVHVVGDDLALELDQVALGGHRGEARLVDEVEGEGAVRVVEHQAHALERRDHLDPHRADVGPVGVVARAERLRGRAGRAAPPRRRRRRTRCGGRRARTPPARRSGSGRRRRRAGGSSARPRPGARGGGPPAGRPAGASRARRRP